MTLDRDLQSRRRLDSPPSIDSIPIHRVPWFGSSRYPIAPTWLRFIEGFDVLHIHAIDFFVDSASIGRRIGLHNKPIVVSTHGGIFHTTAWRRLKTVYWHAILKRSLSAVNKVVADCDADAALFGPIVPPHKMLTIANGIDPAFARPRPPRPG